MALFTIFANSGFCWKFSPWLYKQLSLVNFGKSPKSVKIEFLNFPPPPPREEGFIYCSGCEIQFIQIPEGELWTYVKIIGTEATIKIYLPLDHLVQYIYIYIYINTSGCEIQFIRFSERQL